MSETFHQTRLPLPEEISGAIRESGYAQTDRADKLAEILDQVAPVRGRLTIEVEPDVSEAPDEIRRQWVGLTLPVRAVGHEPGEHPVVITEAMMALWAAGKQEAYWWWHQHFVDEWDKAAQQSGRSPIDGFPTLIGNTHFFIFDEKWGRFSTAP